MDFSTRFVKLLKLPIHRKLIVSNSFSIQNIQFLKSLQFHKPKNPTKSADTTMKITIFCLSSLKIWTYLCCPFEFTQWILPFQRRPGVKPWILPAFEWGSGVKSWSGILPFKRSCGFKPPIGPITVILTVINCGKKILVMGFRT